MNKICNLFLILGQSFALMSCATQRAAPVGGAPAPASAVKVVPGATAAPVKKDAAVLAGKGVPPPANAVPEKPVETLPAPAPLAVVPASVAASAPAVPASPSQPSVIHPADLIPLAFLISLALAALVRDEPPKS